MAATVRRLIREDAEPFRDLRMEGFRLQEREFRFSPDDELAIPMDAVQARLETDFVAGAFVDGELVGVGGITRQVGTKIKHRALLWRMYVRPSHRGSGLSDGLMQKLIDYAMQNGIESIILTVFSENSTANRFYRRWGFEVYAVDRSAVKLADGSYVDETLMVKSCI